MGGSAQTTSTVNYTYNAKNQLMRQAETMADGQQNVSDYTYDRNGNLLARLESRFSAQAGGEAGGHMGEMGKGDKAAETKTATYTYDPFNQLTQYRTMSGVNASYGYYAGGLRSNKTVNGVTTGYYYDGMNVVNEVTNGTVSTNLRGAGYISRKTGDNTPNYFLYNIHTDVTQLTNENGTVVKNYDYDAWGTPTKDDGAQIDNPIRYAGEYCDDESGMIYLRARYYQPEVGRFVSEDPARDNTNWYSYCDGNAVMRFDPSGKVDVPKDGIKSYWTLIPNIQKIMYAKIKYMNGDKSAHHEAQQARQEIENVIDNIDVTDGALNKLIRNQVLDNGTQASLYSVAAVLATAYAVAMKISGVNNTSGQLYSDQEVYELYEKYLEYDVIYVTDFAGGNSYEIMNAYLINGNTSGNPSDTAYWGWNYYGEPAKVQFLDKEFVKEPFSQEDLPGVYKPRPKI